MKGAYDYINTDGTPRVLKIDFRNLEKLNPKHFHSTSKTFSGKMYFCEESFQPLYNAILNED